MILVRLKSNKCILVILVVGVLSGLVGYYFLRKPVVKKMPALYKVVEVIDGDTIRVEMNNKTDTVRLLGINTPEVENPYKHQECFGSEASKKTKKLLEGKMVYLLADPQSSDRGRYGRLLRYVFLSNGEFINADLIKEGYACNYIYEPFQFMKYFDYLEKKAQKSRLGLWGQRCNYYFQVEK